MAEMRGHLEDRSAGSAPVIVDTADLQLADLVPPIQKQPPKGAARGIADVHPVHRPGTRRGKDEFDELVALEHNHAGRQRRCDSIEDAILVDVIFWITLRYSDLLVQGKA